MTICRDYPYSLTSHENTQTHKWLDKPEASVSACHLDISLSW